MIELKSVSLNYEKTAALSAVSLKVGRERAALIGASGSGKTSLLRVIAGFEKPDEGEVVIGGRTCSSKRFFVPPCDRGVGFVFQEPSLWPHLSLYSNVAYGLDHPRSTAGRKRVELLLEKLDLTELKRRKPHELSGGEARRASIARAVAPAPKILLLDEPFAGLDEKLKSTVIELLEEEGEANISTMVVVAHDERAAGRLCSNMVRMEAGRIVGLEAEKP